jgi:tetratricopeptide (TPR) repeat protein
MRTRSVLAAAFAPFLLSAVGAAGADPAALALKKGTASFENWDFDAAIAAFTEAIRLKPKLAEAYSSRGEALTLAGEFDEAIADYSEAIRLGAKSGDLYFSRGLAYQAKGEKAKTEEDFAQAKKLRHKPRS